VKKENLLLLVMLLALLPTGVSLAHSSHYHVDGYSMYPELQNGDVIEIVSEEYRDGDMVVALKKDGAKIVKRLMGDRLVSAGDGTSYSVDEVTILGAAKYTPMSLAELETYGFRWESVLAEGEYIVQVAAGSSHSLALTNTGVVYAWGQNRYGQLGDDSTETRTIPVKVHDGAMGNSDVEAIAAGAYHSLALKDGMVYAWGFNIYGQLGDDSTETRTIPVEVHDGAMGNSDVEAIAAGAYHSLALRNGTAYAWGRNFESQLGDGTTTDRETPVKVQDGAMGNSGVEAIAAADLHSLVLKNGTVYAWGANQFHQLGNGTVHNSSTPFKVLDGAMGNSGVEAIAAGGYHSLALKDGMVYAWGYNIYGQLGDGTTTDRETPVKVQDGSMGNSDVEAIAAGGLHALALKNGKVYAWGANADRQLGNGTDNNHSTPVKTIRLESAEPPVIGSQPADITAAKGDPGLTLEVSAQSMDGGTLSYQWFHSRTNSHADGEKIDGATGPRFQVPSDTPGTFYYFVEVTNTNHEALLEPKVVSVRSHPATVTVLPLLDAETPAIVTQPAGARVARGAPGPVLTVEASVGDGGTLSYQWHQNTANSHAGGTPIQGATGKRYSPPTDQAGTMYYYVVVTNTNENATGSKTASIASNVAEVSVYVPPVRTTPPNVFNVTPAFSRDIVHEDIRLQIPAWASEVTFDVTINKAQNVPEQRQPKDGALVSGVYAITKNEKGDLLHAFTLTLPFSLDDSDKENHEIALYRFDEQMNAWIPLNDLVVHWENRTVSGTAKTFGLFAVIAKEKRPIATPDAAPVFRDVAGHWAENAIRALLAKGWIQGYPDGSFRPAQLMTRAEFAALVVQVLGLDAPGGGLTFPDTANHWARDIIAAAHGHGIISGYNDAAFGPDDPVTREQLAVILFRTFGLQAKPAGQGKTFADRERISPWAKTAVDIAASRGIFAGYSDGTFRPQNPATRAEVAQVMANVSELLEAPE